jgi:hypothetical protein
MIETTKASKYAEPSTTVYLKYEGNIGSGDYGVVHRTLASTREGMEHATHLAYKLYMWGSYEKFIRHSLRMHDYFKKYGLQVPPTYRATSEGILMTDLTENGERLVLSMNDNSMKIKNLKYCNQNLLDSFKNVNLDQVYQDYLPELSKVNAAGILFESAGCWFLVLSKSNEYSVVHTDFDEVKIAKEKKDRKAINEELLEDFIWHLSMLQRSING